MKITVGITVDVPPRELWRYLERIEDHVEWMADARAITFVSSHHRGIGTEFDCLTRVGPFRTTDRMTVTEWEPGRAMGIIHRGIFTGRGRFVLRRRRHGRTRFSWQERLQFPLWMGGPVGALAAKPVLRAIWRRNLRRLKQKAEASAA
ncbi:MAG: Polyketide cyclase / dehydrase and lipid transport [Actinomycetia bacterium]|nr:Polyketide cyclase / dehydrase and lipid transport [Actinomycetes bacterium]